MIKAVILKGVEYWQAIRRCGNCVHLERISSGSLRCPIRRELQTRDRLPCSEWKSPADGIGVVPEAELTALRARLQAVEQENDRMQPVVEAARKCCGLPGYGEGGTGLPLREAVAGLEDAMFEYENPAPTPEVSEEAPHA